MKFICNNCGTNYLISDEKIAPQGVKVRCKRCGNLIFLKVGDGKPQTTAREMLSKTAGLGKGGAVKAEASKVFDEMVPGGGDFGANQEEDEEDEGGATEIFSMEELQKIRAKKAGGGALLPGEKEVDEAFSSMESTSIPSSTAQAFEEWHVAIDNQQVGPIPLPELETRWEKGEIGPRTLAWCPGMQDWLSVREIPRLRYLLGTGERSVEGMPLDETGTPLGAMAGPAVEGRWNTGKMSDLASLVEEELLTKQAAEKESARKTGAVPISTLAKEKNKGKDKNTDQNTDQTVDKDRDSGEVPPWEQSDPHATGDVAKPPENFFSSSLDRPSTDTGRMDPSRGGRMLAPPSYLAPKTKRRSFALFVLALVVVVITAGVLGAVFVNKLKNIKEPPGSPQGTPPKGTEAASSPAPGGATPDAPQEGASEPKGKTATAEPGAGFLSSKSADGEMVVKKVGEGKSSEAAAQPGADKGEKADKGAKAEKAEKTDKDKKVWKPKPVSEPRVASAGPAEGKSTEKPREGAAESPSGPVGETLSKAQISETMKKHIDAMKGCVKQQLQRDPSVTGTMLISFIIERSGRVNTVNILSEEHRGSYVAACITYIVKKITFPKFKGEPVTVPKLPLKLGE